MHRLARFSGRRTTCAAIVAALACGNIQHAAADVIYDNLSGSSGGTATASATTWLADALTTGSSAYQLNSITLSLDASGTPTLSVFSDNNGTPGTLLGNLSAGTYASTLSNVVFTSSSGLKLAANSTYWVVLSDAASADWAWTASNTGTGNAFTTLSAESDDAGSTWFIADAYPNQMSVSATASPVPLPATLPLLLSGLIGGGLISRRQAAPGNPA